MGLTHLFLWIFFYLLSCPGALAQGIEASDVKAAYKEILKLRIEAGKEILNAIKDKDRNSHFYYTNNLADILELLITEDRSLYREYEDHEDDHLRALKKLDDSDPYKLFYTADIKLQWALVKLMFGDEFKAGWSLRSALNSIEKNKKLFPDFQPNNKTLGVLHILFATVPDNYQWVMNILGMRSDLGLGWEELNKINDQSQFYFETEVIRSLVSVNIFSDNEGALNRLQKLLGKNKDNLLANYIYNFVLIKESRSEDAISNLKRLLYLSSDYLFIDHIYYLLAEVNMQKANYELARLYYSKFLNHFKGKNYIKDAWYKVFLSFWIQQDISMAKVHHEKALSSGRVFVDADRNAHGVLNQDDYPSRIIMKIRLATDGGYFQLAEQMAHGLTDEDFSGKKDKTEFNYRLARLKHKQQQSDEAIYYYLNAIKKAGKQNWYFAPNSCLNLGYIYKKQNDLVKARHYFNKALSYKKHKYKAGIDARAKAALELLDIAGPQLPTKL